MLRRIGEYLFVLRRAPGVIEFIQVKMNTNYKGSVALHSIGTYQK